MDPLVLVADVAGSLANVHAMRRIVEVLHAALAQRLAVTEVQLWLATGAGRGLEISHGRDGAKVVSHVLPSSDAAEARADGQPRRTEARGGSWLLIAPLLDDGGYVLLRMPASDPAAGPHEELGLEVLRAIGAIVSGAARHVEVMDRVAKLSRRAHVEAKQLRERLGAVEGSDGLVAASPAMKRLVREVVPAVARHHTTVLLRGATGTGKEVLARRIHAQSLRRSRSFVQVNCGAIPEALVESTLFGHERGAFTGAIARHAGVFERAHQGTLLLDEVGDLPPPAQVKLLRVLQSGEIERVGGDRSIAVDVRVIAATHRPLERMVSAGTFREDLYYRLSVFPIEVPPLRDRVEDIDALTTAFVARAAARMGVAAPSISESVRCKLRRHSWPGNVRELENVIERALVLSPGGELRVPFALASAVDTRANDGVEPLHASTRRAIVRALETSGGRIYGPSGAAVMLGLKPSTLQSKMTKLGIARPR